MLFESNELTSLDFTIDDISDAEQLRQILLEVLEQIRVYGVSTKEISAVKIKEINNNNFQIYKLPGLIQLISFTHSSPITGLLPIPETMEKGSIFYLYNKSTIPGTNTVTINLNGNTIFNTDNSPIVLDNNTNIIVLVLIDDGIFLKFIFDSDTLLTTDNTWTGENIFENIKIKEDSTERFVVQAENETITLGEPVSSGYITIRINGQDIKVMVCE